MPEITDEFILSLFSNEKTKEKAFEMLLKKYQKHIYYNARRITTIHEDADDVTQNVCIKIWKNLDKFRNESSLKTWITRICVNEALTYIEKKKRLLNLDDDNYTDFLLVSQADTSTMPRARSNSSFRRKSRNFLRSNALSSRCATTMKRPTRKCRRFSTLPRAR